MDNKNKKLGMLIVGFNSAVSPTFISGLSAIKKAMILFDLYDLWKKREREDEYLGTLISAYIASGGKAFGYKLGESYMDVGTVFSYREAIKLLSKMQEKTFGYPGSL